MPKRKMSTSFTSRKRRRTSYQPRRLKFKRGRNAVPRVLRSLVEKKVYSTSGTDSDLGSNGLFLYLNAGVAQGDGLADRDGRKCTFTKCQFRGEIYPDGPGIYNRDKFVRILIFIDKTPNQEAVSLDDIIDPTHPHMSFRTWNESFRYKLLVDKRVKIDARRLLSSVDINSTTAESKVVEFSVPLKMQSEWLSTSGGTTQMTKNSLVACVVSNETTSDLAFNWISRMQFVDL